MLTPRLPSLQQSCLLCRTGLQPVDRLQAQIIKVRRQIVTMPALTPVAASGNPAHGHAVPSAAVLQARLICFAPWPMQLGISQDVAVSSMVLTKYMAEGKYTKALKVCATRPTAFRNSRAFVPASAD